MSGPSFSKRHFGLVLILPHLFVPLLVVGPEAVTIDELDAVDETLGGSVCKEDPALKGKSRDKRGSAAEPSQHNCSCKIQYPSLDVIIAVNLTVCFRRQVAMVEHKARPPLLKEHRA